MKTFTFRVTQPLKAYYEGRVSVEAKSEKAARKILENMTQNELEDTCENWEQQTDNADPDGDIEIQELKNVE